MAVRCFWESMRLAPTHRRATFQLGQMLRALDHPAAEVVEARAMQLIQLTQLIDRVLIAESRFDEPHLQTARLLEQFRQWIPSDCPGTRSRGLTLPSARG